MKVLPLGQLVAEQDSGRQLISPLLHSHVVQASMFHASPLAKTSSPKLHDEVAGSEKEQVKMHYVMNYRDNIFIFHYPQKCIDVSL